MWLSLSIRIPPIPPKGDTNMHWISFLPLAQKKGSLRKGSQFNSLSTNYALLANNQA